MANKKENNTNNELVEINNVYKQNEYFDPEDLINEESNSNNDKIIDAEFFEISDTNAKKDDSKIDNIYLNSQNELEVIFNVDKEFSYANYHANLLNRIEKKNDIMDLSFIKELKVINHSNMVYENIRIEFKFSNTIFSISNILISILEHTRTLDLKIPLLNVDRKLLGMINSIEPCNISVYIYNNDTNTLLYKMPNDIIFKILPISQPSNIIFKEERLYAKFILPFVTSVKQISLDALKYLNGRNFLGYQNDDPNFIIDEAKALYLAIRDYNIAYQNPPANSCEAQRLRLANEVINDKKGTCIDLSLLYCSCLEEVGIHSLLVLIDGHAFTGIILDEEISLQNGHETAIGKISKYISSGNSKMLFVETTDLCTFKMRSFIDAVLDGNSRISMYDGVDFNAIDVTVCHKSIFASLPTNDAQDVELLNKVKGLNIDETTIDPITSWQYIDISKEQIKDRFTYWEKKLLDLTEANQLINYRFKVSNCAKIISTEPFYNFVSRNNSFNLYHIDINENPESYFINSFFKQNLTPEKYDKTLKQDLIYALCDEKILKDLIKKSQSADEETGAPTLYLCFGVISFMSNVNQHRNHAPFMLLPVRIKKEKNNDAYKVEYDFDDIMINETVFEYYQLNNPDDDFSSLYSIDPSYKYLDIVNTFKNKFNSDIQLDENIFFLSNLTFSNYILWLDMRKRKEELKKNSIVKSIIENHNMIENNEINEDISEDYNTFAAPLNFDSTQLRAIKACGNGKSFILDGPPGTGKSQTIVNMIVNAFYQGKTVLFVAEKKAALDVVAERLHNIKLDRFCLELHSNKASKTEFFNKLSSSMEEGRIKHDENFDSTCEKLKTQKDELSKVIEKIHSSNKYYLSLYDAILIYFKYKNENYSLELPSSIINDYDDAKNKEVRNIILQYQNIANQINDFNNNPLKLVGSCEISFNEREEIVKFITDFKKAFHEFLDSFYNLASILPIEVELNQKNIALLIELFTFVFRKEIYQDGLTDILSLPDDSEVYECFAKTKELNEFYQKYNNFFVFSKLRSINAKEAIKSLEETNGLKGLFTKHKYCKLLKSVCLVGTTFDNNNIISYYQQIDKHNELINNIENTSGFINKINTVAILDSVSNIDSIIVKYNNSKEFLKSLKELSTDHFAVMFKYFVDLYNVKTQDDILKYSLFEPKYTNYIKFETDFRNKFDIDYKNLSYKGNVIKYFEELLDYILLDDSFNELLNIALINKLNLQLKKLGLENLVYAINDCKLDYNQMNEALDYALAINTIKTNFQDEDINYFNDGVFDSKIKEYVTLINNYNNLVIEEVAAKLTNDLNYNNINYVQSSKVGQLKKFMSKSGRGTTIRKTLIDYDDIIKEYFPCFLMSPLSAAQYLACEDENGKGVSKFDIVIFDEASQIPTYKAIGAIARGKSLIVAGDPEQMPPSNYFDASIDIEGTDIQYEDADSLLDECMTIGLPRVRLHYHYRSKYESLINFSNLHFYNNSLFTFPSSNIANNQVEYRYVELSAKKANTNISKEELDAILNVFKEIYTNPNTKDKTIGIIVFNVTQQAKVYDKISALLNKDKVLSRAVEEAGNKKNEPWFVKSIENVQGDERDIVILSVGFRLNANGKAVVIGPIARDHGERRLNVAITRSKEKMYVISTIKSTDFVSDELITNTGTLLLKKYLKYAEDCNYKRNDISKDENTLATFIKEDLEALGYDVVLNVGDSSFKVDIAIKDPAHDRYLLGVLIDNNVDENINLRDKLYLERQVLNGLKWNLLYVYSVSYYKNKKAVINNIVNSIYKEVNNEETALTVSPSFEHIIEEEFKYKCFEYQKYNYNQTLYFNKETGFDNQIHNVLLNLIKTESPISFDTIKDRIKEYSKMARMTDNAIYSLNKALQPFTFKQVDGEKVFYFSTDDYSVSSFRTKSNLDITDISKEEIACAMKQIIELQGEISQEDLFKTTLQILCYSNDILSKKNIDRLLSCCNYAKEKYNL